MIYSAFVDSHTDAYASKIFITDCPYFSVQYSSLFLFTLVAIIRY